MEAADALFFKYCVVLALLTSCVACMNDKPGSSDVSGSDLVTPVSLSYDRESGDGLMNVRIKDTSFEQGSFTGSELVDLDGSDLIGALVNGNSVGFQRITQGIYQASFNADELTTFQFSFSRGSRDFIYYGEFLSGVEFGLTLAESDLTIGQSVDLDIVLDLLTGEESSNNGGEVQLSSADYNCTLPSGEMRNGDRYQ